MPDPVPYNPEYADEIDAVIAADPMSQYCDEETGLSLGDAGTGPGNRQKPRKEVLDMVLQSVVGGEANGFESKDESVRRHHIRMAQEALNNPDVVR